MKLKSIIFGTSEVHNRCVKVLEYSAKLNTPNTELEIIQKPQRERLSSHDSNNFTKTIYHNEIIQDSQNGEVVGLLDCDTFILKDLSDLESMDFDIVFTHKEGKTHRAPINSGVVFVRVSEKTKQFYRDWLEVASRLFRCPTELIRLKQVYMGINQSALSILLKEKADLNFLMLPTRIWNYCPINYHEPITETRIVHIVANMRKAIFEGREPTSPNVRELRELWLKMESKLGGSLQSKIHTRIKPIINRRRLVAYRRGGRFET